MNESIACATREGLVLKWCYEEGGYRPAVLGDDGWVCCSCGHRIQDWVSKLLYGHKGITPLSCLTDALDCPGQTWPDLV